MGLSRLRRRKRSRSRIATKWSWISDTDCRRDSFRSHLLTARAHGDAIGARWGEEPKPEGPGTAPLSSELRHHTAYPAESKPEATWAQPLIREELS
jgi:hypothetical protein